MKVKLPIEFLTKLDKYLATNMPGLQPKVKLKLIIQLIEIFIIISTNNDEYGLIHRDKFKHIRITLNGKRLLYNEVIKILIDVEIIRVDNSYCPGVYTKSYFANIKDYTKLVNINFSIAMYRSIKTKEQLISEYPAYTKLINDLYLAHVDIDNFLDDTIATAEVDCLHPKIVKKYEKTDMRCSLLDYYISYLYKSYLQGLKVNLGIHRFSVSRSGRVHTIFTSISDKSFKYITLNGVPILDIDAVNCQPLLLSSFIKNNKFKEVCEAGLFYETLAEELNIIRDDAKEYTYSKILFNNKKIKDKAYKDLEKVFPGLANEINKYKVNDKAEAKALEDAGKVDRLLWYMLQKLESDIFIRLALKLSIPVITRHDSFLIMEHHADMVRELLLDEYKKYKINVKLKTK